jgi:hypothetical protein
LFQDTQFTGYVHKSKDNDGGNVLKMKFLKFPMKCLRAACGGREGEAVREGNRGEAQGVNSPSEQFQGNWLHVQKH